MLVIFTVMEPPAVRPVCKSTKPNDCGLLNPSEASVLLIALVAPPSGKLLKDVNEVPFSIPDGEEPWNAAITTISAASLLPCRVIPKLPLVINCVTGSAPFEDCPTILTVLGVDLAHVNPLKLIQVSADAAGTRATHARTPTKARTEILATLVRTISPFCR